MSKAKAKTIEPLSPFPSANKSEALALGKTLYRAVEKNEIERVEKLIQRGAALNWSDEHVIEAATALKVAARFGRLECLKLIISLLPADWPHKEAYIDDKDEKGGATALDLATWYGHDACVDTLLQEGAHVTYNAEMDMTTGCYAVNSGRTYLIKRLLKEEIKGNVGDPVKEYFWNSLHEKILDLPTHNYPFCKLQIGLLFQKMGCKTQDEKKELIHRPGPQLISALHLAAVINPAVLQYFLELGADPERQCAFGKSAVHFACGGGDVDCASLLSEYEATKQPPSSAKLTPLLRAIRFGRKELVKFFLLEGHPLVGKELNYAAGYCDVEVTSLFVNQVSEQTTLSGLSAVATAITFSSDTAILDFLAENGAEIMEGGTFSMYYSALRTANYHMIEKLFEIAEKREMYQGWDLLSKHGQAFLYSALSANREDIALLILRSYRKGVENGKFSLIDEFSQAQELGEGELGQSELRQKNSSQQLKPFFAKLATDFISLAVVTGLLDVVQYLFEWGADLNTKVGEYNLLTIATLNGDTDLVLWLSQNGARSQRGMQSMSDYLMRDALSEPQVVKRSRTMDRIASFLVSGSILFICAAVGLNLFRGIMKSGTAGEAAGALSNVGAKTAQTGGREI